MDRSTHTSNQSVLFSVAINGKFTVAPQHRYQRDGYYAKDDPAHIEASAWAGRGAEALELSGPVDPDTFQATLEGKVPDGLHLGRCSKDGEIKHCPGRDVTNVRPQVGVSRGDGRRTIEANLAEGSPFVSRRSRSLTHLHFLTLE